MGSSWLHIFLGWQEVHMTTIDDYEDIPRPRTELGIYYTLNAWQIGTVGGAATGAAAHFYFRGPRTVQSLISGAKKWGCLGSLAGLCLGPIYAAALCYFYMTDEQVFDRCFLLRHDVNYLRKCRSVLVWSAVGLISGRLGGYVVGHTFGHSAAILKNKCLPDFLRAKEAFELQSEPMQDFSHTIQP